MVEPEPLLIKPLQIVSKDFFSVEFSNLENLHTDFYVDFHLRRPTLAFGTTPRGYWPISGNQSM